MTFSKRNLYNHVRIFLTIALLVVYPAVLSAQITTDALNSGTTWLLSARYGMDIWVFSAPPNPLQTEFTIDDYTRTHVRDSLEAIKALQTVEVAIDDYKSSIDRIRLTPLNSTEQLSQKIQILSKSGRDVTSLVDGLAAYKNSDGGFGGAKGYPSNIVDTAFALQALSAVQYVDTTVVNNATSYIISAQNADGGFGFYQGKSSNTYMTALVSSTLQQFPQTTSIATAINKTTSYLIAHQNTDGGFGSSPSTVYETSLAYIALVGVSTDATVLGNAVNYLTTSQSADGSWNDDPYSTALALRALASVKPNLSVSSSDISFSKSMPLTGEPVTITAAVKNTGMEDASNVVVRFYQGNPAAGGTQIGAEQIIPLLAHGSSAQVSITNAFTGTGSKTIYAIIDPDNAISEISEIDNTSSKNLWIATGPDVAVYSEDLKPSTYVPVSGTAFTLSYTIRNLGETDTGAFLISLYDGNPSQGGALLQTESLSGISGAQIRTGALGVTLSGNGSHTLYLVADSASQISELSEANNTGSVSVEVGGTISGADLAVTPMDITFTPSRPSTNETVQITATVRNQGMENANNFLVEIYNGAPESGGTFIASQTLSLAPGAEQTITTYWAIPSGIHDIYVILDRSNGIIETDENNNSASARIMPDMIDIVISATDLVLNPSRPVSGDTVVLNITVHNQGIRDTGAFSFALYDGDPNANSGQGQAQPLQTFAIANISGDGSAILTYTFTAQPQIYRFYAIADTENQVLEMYEDNNQAIRSLKIKAPGEILGPDLLPIKIDLSDAATDPQTLAITGTAHVTLQNKGDDKITNSFDVIVFEDTDSDGRYTAGIDTLLGTGANTLILWPEGANIVDINLNGKVSFLHAPLYTFVDSGDSILEQNEENNLLRSGADCEVRPAYPIQPVLKWKWRSGSASCLDDVRTPPVVAYLHDDNGDGKIDEKDTPYVLFTTPTDLPPYWPYWCGGSEGILHAVNGKTGQEIFSIRDATHPFSYVAHIVVGDINNDGLPEIIIPSTKGALYAYKNNGTLLWDNYDKVKAWTAQGPTYSGYISSAGVPAIADIDADGNPEIIIGKTAVNGDGSIKWGRNYYGTTGTGSANGIIESSQVVDLDLDGKQEVVAGFTAYNADGSVRWSYPQYTDGITAIGNLDDDIYPEIVLVTNYQGRALVHLLDHDGQRRWGPVDLKALNLPNTNFAGYGSPPTIADFDGDGEQEIGITGNGKYFILDKDGNLKRTLSIPGYNSQPIAATVFDLNGDGSPEVIIHTAGHFRIFDGPTGQLRYEEPFGAGWSYQTVLIADVDGDNHAEIVVVGGSSSWGYTAPQTGVNVYSAKNNDWVNARKIWNQAGYHVTNVNDDGSIPQHEAPSWLLNNTYHVQAPVGQNPNPYLTPNLTASYLRAVQTGSTIDITVRIGNGGAKEASSGIPVIFYDGDPSTGNIIGTASTTKTLMPGEYQDIIYSWSGMGEGSHQIYAVVDDANNISECREDDNQAKLDISAYAGLPDLTVSQVTISQNPIEGQPASIQATIQNIGTVGAQGVSISFYNGEPNSGGVLIGSVTKSYIDAGATAFAEITWNTLGQSGRNYIYIIIDRQNTITESNENNNTAVTPVDVAAPSKPDLAIAISDITFSNPNPKEGDALTINAAIHNLGLDTSDIEIYLYDGIPASGGILLDQKTIYQIISSGGVYTASFSVNTTNFAGSYNFYISVDPNNKIEEISETNNTTWSLLTIGASGLDLSLSTDKTAYTANEDVLIDISITSTSSVSRTIDAAVTIEDTLGSQVNTVTTLSNLIFAAGETRTFPGIIYNTGKTFAGDYRVHVNLMEAGKQVKEVFANFSILAVKQAASAITTDKIAYSSNEPITLTSTVTSQSPNTILTGLEATIDVTDPQGAVIFTETRTLSDLMPEARIEFKSFTNTGAYPAGIYTANLKIKSNGELLTSASTTFEILSSLSQAMALSGTISANPGTIFEKESTTLSYTIQNIGNDIDLPLIQTEILIVESDTELPVRTLTGETSLNDREVYANDIIFDSTGLSASGGPKPYLIVLRATIAGVIQTLSSTGLTINSLPNNAPIANAGPDQFAFSGQPVLLDGSLSTDPDGDPLFFTWLFTLVPNASQTTDTDISNSMTPTPSFVPDAEGIYTLSLVVNDGLADSQTDTVSVFVNPPAKVDIHPETINLKSNGGSKSITGVLTSPVLSSFEFFTAEDGITVTSSFSLENKYIDKDGNEIIFTVPAEGYPGYDTIVPVDTDGDGNIDLYQLTLKFNRDYIIAGFTDASGSLRITQATELTSTIIGNGIRVGSDVNTVILPPEVKK